MNLFEEINIDEDDVAEVIEEKTQKRGLKKEREAIVQENIKKRSAETEAFKKSNSKQSDLAQKGLAALNIGEKKIA